MFMVSRFAALLSGALLAIAAVGEVRAEYVDPPGRVARLSYTRGEVSFSPGGESDWVDATRNRPLIRGDRLWTGRGALAELQAGNATFRVDEGTSLSILNLNDETAQIEITQGTLNLRVRRIYEGQIFEVDTPTLAFVVSRPGQYRIDVDPRGQHTTVAVLDGGGEAYGDKANFRIREGEAIRFYDTRLTDYEAFDIPRPDDFDRFCMDRDESFDRSASRRYVSEDLIGYSDLDEYGSWSTEADYGAVWYPTRVAADWAPYRDGHWIWQEPWGWTWVDDAAWGFAPFHYGRWAHVRNRWGWIPGPISSRPVYAPALVAFVGGHNWSVGINVGRPIGWFPLGPREIYVPPYRSSRRYFTSVNVTNTVINNTYITNIYNDYSSGRNVTGQINYFNRGVNGAVTAVSGDTFVNSRPVRGAQVRFDRDMALRGDVSQVASIAPVNRSVLGAGRSASAVPQREVFDRAVVARTAPPRDVVPFADRQQALQRTPGRALTPEAAGAIRQRERPADATQRIRVVDADTSRNARTLDADPGSRGGPPARTREPGQSPVDRGTPNRDAAVRERGSESIERRAPDAAARETAPRERVAPNQREVSPRERGAPNPAERDFTRPDVREREAPTIRRQPVREDAQREAPQRESIQRERDQSQREQADRQERQRESIQRDQAQREQADRQREQVQRERDQAQREQTDRQERQRESIQRDQAQREQADRQREQVQRERDQAQREQSDRQERQREQADRQREQVQRERDQAQREQADRQREQVQREQADRQERQRESMQREREQAQREQADRQRDQQAQREQQQAQREQAQRDQQAQREQAERQRDQQAQREQQQAQRQQAQREQQAQQREQSRQREAPPQQQRDQAPERRRGRDDGDDRKNKDDDRR